MTRLLAYHWVSGGGKAVDRIRRDGLIMPAASRTKVAGAMDLCMGVFEEYEMIDPDKDVMRIRKAFRLALEERLAQPRPGASPDSNLGCVDFLAGDASCIFLKPGDWYLGREPNGFVFDAEELISRGATVRLADLVDRYTDTVDLLIYGHRGTPQSLARALIQRLGKVRRETELSGLDALEALEAGARGKDAEELVWEGPLPVTLAAEVWKQGEPSRV